jgi:hypothetical protein
LAARFSDDISARWSITPRLSCVPGTRREWVFFSVSMSSLVIASISSSGCLLSLMTIAVINLVNDAIGRTACGFLL